jgi:hypothetical protein
MRQFIENGDDNDNLKWDFDESTGYNTIYIDGYPYKVLKQRKTKHQENVANKLHKLRILTDKIANNIGKYGKGPGVDIFKYIHKDNDGTTNYLLSEIKPSTGFAGLNKPKSRVLTNEVFVGADENIRARWRDIFLTIDPRNTDISEEELELFVHELAHTGANHVQFRPDDHRLDFTSFENLIWYTLNNTI